MKKKIRIQYDAGRTEEREINYIPLRYILALLLVVLETAAVITVLILFGKYIPYFYLAMWATEIGCVIHIIACDEAPDYKIPWLLVVLIVPIAGFMLYFLFGKRTLKRKFIRRLKAMREQTYPVRNVEIEDNAIVSTDARMLCKIADANLFANTTQQYFPLGEDMHKQLLVDLETAEKFIFMDYFIVEEGIFWNSILDILKKKAAAGVEVRVIYDDIGCMMTLPGKIRPSNETTLHKTKEIIILAKFADHMDKIAEGVTEGYQKIEDGVVTGYKKIEDGVVGGFGKVVDACAGAMLDEEGNLKTGKVGEAVIGAYKKVESAFVNTFMAREGETVEEAKARIAAQQKVRDEQMKADAEARETAKKARIEESLAASGHAGKRN